MRLYIDFLLLLLEGGLDSLGDLAGDVVNVGATFACADAIDKAHLLELAIAQAADNFPPICLLLDDLWQGLVLMG